MEEVDNIIIHSLRQIGCDIEESITSLNSFNAELVVHIVVKCLTTIQPDLNICPELPPSMAARLRVGTTLAEKIKELKYNGTVGYHTFLYPSDVELRRLIPFLTEKLPTPKEDKIEDINISKISLLEKSVAKALSVSLTEPWLPHYCHKQEVKFMGQTKILYNSTRLDAPSRINKSKDYEYYCKHYQKSVPEQVTHKADIFPCILSYNSKLLYSRPTNMMNKLEWITSQQEHKNTETQDSSLINNIINNIKLLKCVEDTSSKESEFESPIESSPLIENSLKEEETYDSNLEQISKECEELRINIETTQLECNNVNKMLSDIKHSEQIKLQDLTILKEQKNIIPRLYEWLNEGDAGVKNLEYEIEVERWKLLDLAEEWETVRNPLIEKYWERSSKSKVDEMQLLKEKQQELHQELKNKEHQYEYLVNEIQKVSKDTNRSAYTQRISEIINNIRKQKDEIEKVIKDAREIKKDINNLTGRIERSFAVAIKICEDHRANSLLHSLHRQFNLLIESVKKTGEIIRKIRDLEEQIDIESAKNVEANLIRITADLQQMKQETETLVAQLNDKRQYNDQL